jgi:hypothetical protein
MDFPVLKKRVNESSGQSKKMSAISRSAEFRRANLARLDGRGGQPGRLPFVLFLRHGVSYRLAGKISAGLQPSTLASLAAVGLETRKPQRSLLFTVATETPERAASSTCRMPCAIRRSRNLLLLMVLIPPRRRCQLACQDLGFQLEWVRESLGIGSTNGLL